MKFLKNKKSFSPQKKSVLREWFSAIMFAVVAATFIRGLFFEVFAIPTGSMENTMMIGDHLVVSKLHYGTRTPRTLLQLPLMHQTISGTNIPSYLDWIQLPSKRLPSLSALKRNDLVVFNYPPEIDRPVDMRTFYVKRCIGMPGDTFKIVDKQVYINNNPLENPVPLQSSYLVKSEGLINDRIFTEYNISDIIQTSEGYLIQTNKEAAKKLSGLSFIKEVKELQYPLNDASSAGMFPDDVNLGWTIDNFGPLYIPKEGQEITLDKENIAFYKDVILNHEDVNASINGGKIYIDGNLADKYTFKQDYYFMLGDNRHNSLDSRSWGFVPANHIVGKPLFVAYSKDLTGMDNDNFLGVRWKRMLYMYE